MRDRAILHIDMNAFYASVAQHRDPALRGKAIAVAGDPKRRNGIILAKSREAKAAGVKTGEAIWQAQQKCPHLIIVPPDYHAYKRYSKLARMLYYEYTNQVEPFGLDESWIDVTGPLHLFGDAPSYRETHHTGVPPYRQTHQTRASTYTHPLETKTSTRSLEGAYRIAQEISERIKAELGLTVSIGISWNKVFAKLGSDTDPGDGILCITRDNYRQLAWPMPASSMIYIGPATTRKLTANGFYTIGDVAHASDAFLQTRFGKIGFMLRSFARGEDRSQVRVMDPAKADVDYVIKGIGNGLTAPHDLVTEKDVEALVWLLSESVGQRLREAHFRCRTVSVGARRAGDLSGYSRQTTLSQPTCLTRDIARLAMGLLRANQPFDRAHALRAIHVRTTNLVALDGPRQLDLFGEEQATWRQERLDLAIDELRRRFGNSCVRRVVELSDETMRQVDIKRDNTVHPIGFLR